jgi:hypothetical protein
MMLEHQADTENFNAILHLRVATSLARRVIPLFPRRPIP